MRKPVLALVAVAITTIVVVANLVVPSVGPTVAGAATPQLNGVGSSFAAPAIETFASTVKNAPYDLNVSYTSSSSGDGRFEFANNTTNFAVSDIPYGLGSTDATPPTFPFIYVPVTAAGIAFMYRIDGLTKNLQLSSFSACGILTGGITNWDDPAIATDNPGVTLPNLAIRPVTESDSAGTNYVLQEWCIAEQPALWAAFANQQNDQAGGPGDGVVISPTTPEANWPGLPNGLDQQSTSGVAGNVATNNGAIGAAQVKYATDLGFGTATPAHSVASVKNASGDYTQPTPVDVESALAYATQQANGTHKLNFAGTGPNVYSLSTYSYLLAKTTGSDPALGAVLSGFVNYALTLGQQTSPTFGYAELGLSLEQYGINQVKANVPGAVPLTASEQEGLSCGGLTPAEVQAGQTAPTCGTTGNGSTAGVSLVTNAPSGPFSSGQRIEVSVGPNSTLTPGVGVYIEECSAPDGSIPTSPSQCDVKTHQESPLFSGKDGSVDFKGYPIFALPDSPSLGESPSGGGPTCDLNDECILYLGQNPNDFAQPHVWSAAFSVKSSDGDAGTDPGDGLPEVPFIVALPTIALVLFGASSGVRRRKLRRLPGGLR